MKCKICKDVGWVCEEHQDKPHEHYMWLSLGEWGRCSGAGMPCQCNKANPPWNYHNPK